jgi:DNA invertase Pin-like site-specific DNA recombinase
MADSKSNRLLGYARVSTRDQETHLQIAALRRAGVDQIYEEKASSVGRRPMLQVCLQQLQPGDTLVVYKIDRIARSLSDLLIILEKVSKSGAAIKSLTEPLDTSGPIGMFMIQVLGAVAQLERSIIRERTVAGQIAAIDRGVRFGRPKKLNDFQEAEVLRLVSEGRKKASIAREFNVSLIVVRRILDEANGITQIGRLPILGKQMASQ